MRNMALILGLALCGTAIGTVGCSSANDAQQTAKRETEAARERAKQAGDEVSDAVKNAKPELNKAGEKVGEAARTVVDDAKAATRGVQEGWDKGQPPRVNLNTAKEKELVALPGIGPGEARRIIASRPYRDARETVKRGAITETEYEQIQDRVTTR
jgi:DNA uptake protein ComE-like DNA-binding protein